MKQSAFFLAFAVALTLSGVVGAQDPDYVLTMNGPATVAPGGTATISVRFENVGAPSSGLQYGVCHDTGVLLFNGDGAFGVDGAALDTTFAAATNQGTDGYTTGILLNVITGATFGTGDDLMDVTNGSYSATEAGAVDGASTDIEFCDTLGSPAVVTAVVVAGSDVTPTQNNLSIGIALPTLVVTYNLDDIEIGYDPATGIGAGAMTWSIEEDSGNDGFPNDTQGFQGGIEYDSDCVSITGLAAIGDLDALAPGFFGVNLTPGLPAGVNGAATLGVVYSLMGGVFLAFDGNTPVVEITVETNAATLTGDLVGKNTIADFRDDIGDPELPSSIVVDGNSFLADKNSGLITLTPVIDQPFIRGNCNNDGIVNIADGIWSLNELFLAGPTNVCEEACDANDDGSYDQTDAVYIFNFQFLGGPPPPAPFPDCGTEEGAPCDNAHDVCD